MKTTGRWLGIMTVAWMLLLVAAPGGLEASDQATVKIVNKSDWVVVNFFMSPVDVEEWGPDQLEDKVIRTDESFALTDVPCNLWDIMIVDEDGDECVLGGVDLCGEEAIWKLTDKELLSCQAATE